MKQKILLRWNLFWGSNQHFTNYTHPLSSNERSLASSTGFNLAGWLSPPMKLRQIDLPNCCLWNQGRSGVWGNNICLLNLSLQNQLALFACIAFLLGCASICFFNEEWSAVFLEESNKPPRQSDETFGRQLGSINMAYKLSVLKQISLFSIFILLLTCLSLQQQILLKWKTIQRRDSCVNLIWSIG